MKYSVFVLLTIFFSIGLHAQRVFVYNQESQPLPEVEVSDGLSLLHTFSDGSVDVSAFKGSDITFSKDGYLVLTYTWQQLMNQGFKVVMLPDNFELDEVIVSANKWEQPVEQVPATVVPVNLNGLLEFAPQTAADLLGTTHKVFIQKSQLGGGSPVIRGFAANRVLIVVDGVRMNNAIYRSGNLQNVINIDPYSIKESEIILGPASNIYGSDAIGGVMDFHTKTPYMSTNEKPVVKGNFNTAIWSANKAYSIHLDLNAGFNKIAFLTSFSRSLYSDLQSGTRGPQEFLRPSYQAFIDGRDTVVTNGNPEKLVPTGFSQSYFMQKIRFKPADNFIVTYGFHFSTTSDVPRYDRLIQTKNGQFKYAQWYYGPQQWIMHNLNLAAFGRNKFFDKASVTAAYQDYSESRHDRKFNNTQLRERFENVKVASLNLDFVKQTSDYTSIFYGAEGVYNFVRSTGMITDLFSVDTEPYPSRYPDSSYYATAALYMQIKTKAGTKLVIDYGIRLTYATLYAPFSSDFYQFPFERAELESMAPSASAGAVYSFNENLRAKLNIATGFRAPNIDDIGKVFDSEPGKVIVPNPQLQPEYVYSAETGIDYKSDNLLFRLTGFYSYLDNAMVREDYLFNGQDSIYYDGVLSRVEALVNADYAIVYGFEGTFALKFLQYFTAKASAVVDFGRDSQNRPFRHVPPPYFYSSVSYLASEKLKFELYGLYSAGYSYEELAPSEQSKPHLYAEDDLGRPYSPQWWTLNATVFFQVQNAKISAGVKNIFDKLYRPYSSGINGEGRNFFMSFAYGF